MIIFLGNGPTLELYRDFIEETKKDLPDLVVSCQYPFKIPESLIKSHLCVNIHYGKLPEFAGCNPIYWQLLKTDTAGATLHYVDKDWDTGDIIDIYRCPTAGMTADDLYKALSLGGLSIFKHWYKSILHNTAPRSKQDLSKRGYYKKNDVVFKHAKHIDCLNDKRVRALHFEGKQYPIVNLGGNDYEIRRYKPSV